MGKGKGGEMGGREGKGGKFRESNSGERAEGKGGGRVWLREVQPLKQLGMEEYYYKIEPNISSLLSSLDIYIFT